jgi:putative ABC transport system ATP-binding protein
MEYGTMASKAQSTTKLLGKIMRAESKEIGVILAYGIGVSLLSLAVPIGVQALVNTVTFGSLSQPLLFLVLAVFGGLALAAVFRGLQVIVIERLQTRFFSYIALELSARLPRVRIDRLSGAKFPELVNRFFDVLVVQKSTATLLLEGFGLVLQTLIGLLLLAFYHPALLAFDLVLVLAMIGVLFGLGQGAVKTSIEESVHKYRVAAWLEEVAAKSLSFRTAEARVLALRKADELVVGYLNARRDHFRILFRQIIGSLSLQAIASAALLGLGAVLVTRNQLTLGQLVAAELVVTNVLTALAKFQKQLEAFYDLAAGLDKIEGLMELPLERAESQQRLENTGPGSIQFNSVAFNYPSSNFALAPLTHEIKPQRKVALQGPNGSGKSTVVDILFGMKQPTSGTILVDNVDFRELGLEELRRHICLVRGIEFVAGTVIENVVFGRTDVSVAQAKDALQKVGLLDEVLRLPDGIHTHLAENGSPLSVASAQGLMIARAIAGAPRVLVIDECLDALDAASTRVTLNTLLDKDAPWTLILCTHDQEVARRCDEQIVLGAQTEGRVA